MKKQFLLLTFLVVLSNFHLWVYAQDFWQSTGFSINTSVFSIVVNSQGHIFAGTGDGIYRSTDNGINWVLSGYTGLVNSLAINSADQLFAATDTAGVCRSTNNGVTWVPTSSTLDYVLYVTIASNGNLYYCNAIGELYKSTDNGDNWTKTVFVTTQTQMWTCLRNDNGYLFFGTYNYGIFRSTNDGQNWTQLSNGLTDTTIWSLANNKAGHIFAGTMEGGVFRSTDNGNAWTQINNGLTSDFIWTLAVNSDGEIFAGTFTQGVFVSNNNGNNWTQINNGLGNLNVYYLYIDRNGYIWAGTDSSIYKSKSPTVLPATININTNISFGDAAKQTSYQMFGLPGNFDLPLAQVMPGSADKDWIAYRDNGEVQGNSFLVKYDGSSAFNFKPGRAFWILSRNNLSVSQTINTVPLTDNYFPIPLQAGWNLISDPFNINVSWNDVKNLNTGLVQPIHNFNNGSYIQPTILEPYKGYYFFNEPIMQTLKIPYGPGLIKAIPLTNNADNQTENNSLKFILKSDDGKEDFVQIMINANSNLGLDQFDIFSPPNNFMETNISIYNENLSTNYKFLMADSRNGIEDGQSYDLRIKNTKEGTAFLNTEGIEHFSEFEIYLLDNNLNKFYNLKELKQLKLSQFHKDYKFNLLIGSEEFIKNKQIALKPAMYELFQNFPNPFNPFTTIKFSLPVQSEVKISLYNSLGEGVEVLSNKILSAGYHEINFDGSKLSSGIYYYSISAKSVDGKDTFNKVRKMILLK